MVKKGAQLFRAYSCACGRDITFDRVSVMRGYIEDAKRHWFVTYDCDACASRYDVELPDDAQELGRMLGHWRPALPYHAAPSGQPPTVPVHAEPALRVFSWECEHLEDVDEFLMLCSR